MSRNTLTAAKAELHGLLTTPAISGVEVYDHEPYAGHAQKPVSVTVSTAGMTLTSYLLMVRVYVTAEPSVELAQEMLDDLMLTVDERVGSTGRFEPTSWEVVWREELASLVGELTVDCGREDRLWL